MFYLKSLLVIFVLILFMALVGRSFCNLLPNRIRPASRLFFTPLFGLAVLILMATLHGWILPFKNWICLTEAVCLAGLSLFFAPKTKTRTIGFYSIFLILYSLIASSTVLFPILRFDGFNPFNDTFTYLVHGQWLQTHPFSEPVSPSGFFPALTQVYMYQVQGSRMGGSFFLAWVQGLFGVKWSYWIYPAVTAMPLIAGSLAIGGAIALLFRKNRGIALLAALGSAVVFNGFTYGSLFGFLPQTFGLAFSVGSIALFSFFVSRGDPATHRKKIVVAAIPLSLCLSAMTLCYNDMLPFMGAAFFLSQCAYLFLKPGLIKNFFLLDGSLIVQILILINVEFFRVLKNLKLILGFASGLDTLKWPAILWSPLDFLGHAFGFLLPFEGVWLFGSKSLSVAVLWVGILFILYYLFRQIKDGKINQLYPHLFMLSLFFAAFLYFRYGIPPPSAQETGHTFLQLKVSQWASPFCFVMMGAALSFWATRKPVFRKIIPTLAGLVILISMGTNFTASRDITNPFLEEVGSPRSPFLSLLHLRELVQNTDPQKPIYVNLGTGHHKLRQFVAYALYDRKVAGDYTDDDGYIPQFLPSSQKKMPFEASDWVIEFKRNQEDGTRRSGNMTLGKRPEYLANLVSVSGGYDRETDGKDWWYWANRSISFNYQLLGRLTRIKLKFTHLSAGGERTVKIIIQTGKMEEFIIKMAPGWHEYVSPPIDIEGPNLDIRFLSEEEPVRLSKEDSRMASFLIKNLEFIS
jgi:hypothetical protein